MSEARRRIGLIAIVALGTTQARSAVILNAYPDTGEAPAGFVSNNITIDTTTDLTAVTVHIKLDTGVLYNPDPFSANIETAPQAPGDTYVTIGGNPNTYIAGGAGDLGHPAYAFGPTTLAVTYYDIAQDDIGTGLPMGTFSFSDDATGRGIMAVPAKGGTGSLVYVPFDITNGALPAVLPEPQTTFTPLDPPTYPQPPQLPPPPPGAPQAFFRHVPQSVVPGVIVNDLVVHNDTDWQNASVRIELYAGSVFNSSPFDSDLPLPPEISEIPGYEDVAYDTYVGIAGDGTTSILGSADGLSFDHHMADQLVDVRWSNVANADTGTFAIGRFSLTEDAYGTVTIDVDGYTRTSYIYFGFLGGIPEPATIAWLCLAGPALLRRRIA